MSRFTGARSVILKSLPLVGAVLLGVFSNGIYDLGKVLVTNHWRWFGGFGCLLAFVAAQVIRKAVKRRWERWRTVTTAMDSIRWNGRRVFQVEKDDEDRIKNLLGKFRVAPVAVLVQLKLKRHFSWVDALYIRFVHKLAAGDFAPTVLIHDYDYGVSSEGAIGDALESDEYEVDLRQHMRCIEVLTSGEVHTTVASKFLPKEGNAENFVDLFYRRFLPNAAMVLSGASAAANVEIFRFLVGVIAGVILGRGGISISVVWERRKEWISRWRKNGGLESLLFIYGRTLHSESGDPFPADAREESVNLDDDPSVFAKKIAAWSDEQIAQMWDALVKDIATSNVATATTVRERVLAAQAEFFLRVSS